jgi:hypothetical protein
MRYFWTPNLNHFQRILISAFVYVNALNPEIFIEWVHLLGLARDRAASNHFEALLDFFIVDIIVGLYMHLLSLIDDTSI